jgi:hypothetical protein
MSSRETSISVSRPTYAFGLVAFVPAPGLRGLYLKTHVCVDHVACPTCKAEVGAPCMSRRDTAVSSTHFQRRDRFFGRARL